MYRARCPRYSFAIVAITQYMRKNAQILHLETKVSGCLFVESAQKYEQNFIFNLSQNHTKALAKKEKIVYN